MENVEFKAEIRDLPLARTIARGITAHHIITVEQTDTYYRVPSGRLKKREATGEPTEYIIYDRPDQAGLKVSSFTIYTPEAARERFGIDPLPVWVTVRKTRELYMHGSVRVHLDIVEGLGKFLEFEALVSPSNSKERCREQVEQLRQAFAPALGEPIACSYADLVARDIDYAVERDKLDRT